MNFFSNRILYFPTVQEQSLWHFGHPRAHYPPFHRRTSDKPVLCPSRRYGTKCGGCLQGINPQDLVRKARDKVFHLNCFTCLVCRKQMSTGEELYVLDDNKFVCKQDYLSGKPLPDTHHVHGHHGELPKLPPFVTTLSHLV